MYKKTKIFINNNPDLLFTRADKGNITVTVSRDDYVRNVETILNDKNTYFPIKKNPIKKIEYALNSLLKTWETKEYISRSMALRLKSSAGHIPRAYGLPKIHKPGHPYRFIVSSVGSPLHNIISFLHDIIHRIPRASSHVENSFDLVKKLKFCIIDDLFSLISLDEVSLFTNSPINLSSLSLEKRWNFIKINTKIPKNDFLSAVPLLLPSTYFCFNNTFYKQISGTPMGSPISPIIADIEEIAFKKLNFIPLFYYQYVDDILLSVPYDKIDYILRVFNSFHHRLQFSVKVQQNNCISFLDISILRDNRRLIFNW